MTQHPSMPPSEGVRSTAMTRLVSSRGPLARAFLVMLFPALVLTACADGPTEPSVDGLQIKEIILAGDDGSFAYSHIDHWHGAPVVRQGETAGFEIWFSELRLAPDDHEAPPFETWFSLADHPEYSLHTVIEDPDLARWSGTSARGTLEGLVEGASRMSFVVRRGPTTVYEAPPVNFRVREPAP